MSNYPDIENEVPAWDWYRGDQPTVLETDGEGNPRMSKCFLTGLAQFVRAVVREMVVSPTGETGVKSETELRCNCNSEVASQHDVPNGVSPNGEMLSEGITEDRAKLAERLAEEAAEQLSSLNGFLDARISQDATEDILLPYFRRAVEGRE